MDGNDSSHPQLSMTPAMSDREIEVFAKYLKTAHHYLEFGCGGSTVLACTLVGSSVTSVDSSAAWIRDVSEACSGLAVKPKLFHADIGPVGEWGHPADDSQRSSWPVYFTNIWQAMDASQIDFCLVDGRFRVACFLRSLLHLRVDAKLAIHDFRSRPEYHIILDFANETDAAEELSIFERAVDFDASTCQHTIEQYQFEQS